MLVPIDPISAAKLLKNVLAENFGDRIREVVLFGSRASGKAREDSDYDVLVILDRKHDWDFWNQAMGLVYDLELEYDILFNVFMISTEELRNSPRGEQPIYIKAVREGIYVGEHLSSTF